MFCSFSSFSSSSSLCFQDNMNGVYPLSATPGSKNMSGLFPNRYSDYPGGAEMFELYSPPISTLYSQVWWAPLAPSAIPQHIVKKYAGKGMAIVGWEIDQVRKGAGPNGEDVPVPISASYNRAAFPALIDSSRIKCLCVCGCVLPWHPFWCASYVCLHAALLMGIRTRVKQTTTI
jgi:hypothetical protein